jgi:hypothetical protein
VAVVGGGLLGSATAKYVSEDAELSILIGPAEDAKLTAEIYGAWFDEGRIAELADSDLVWYKVGEKLVKHFSSRIYYFVIDQIPNSVEKKIKRTTYLATVKKMCPNLFFKNL